MIKDLISFRIVTDYPITTDEEKTIEFECFRDKLYVNSSGNSNCVGTLIHVFNLKDLAELAINIRKYCKRKRRMHLPHKELNAWLEKLKTVKEHRGLSPKETEELLDFLVELNNFVP